MSAKEAWNKLLEFKRHLCDAQTELKKTQKIIDKSTRKWNRHTASAKEARTAAVKFAKKRVMANITVMKGIRAMNEALVAQTASTNMAMRMTQVQANSRYHKVYFKKLAIDKREQLRVAQKSLRIAKMALNTAFNNYAQAKRLAWQNRIQSRNSAGRNMARYQANWAGRTGQQLAIKCAMEKAYNSASNGFIGWSQTYQLPLSLDCVGYNNGLAPAL